MSMKKKLWTRALCCLILLEFVLVRPLAAHAGTTDHKYVYKISGLAQNTWVNVKYEQRSQDSTTGIVTERFHFLKITVPSGGYVQVHSKAVKGEDAGIRIYKTVKTQNRLRDNQEVGRTYNRTFNCYLKKGVYYLYPEMDKAESFSLKWNFIKCSERVPNFCRARALKLASGKKKVLVFDPDYDEVDRWFKLDLPRRRYLYIYSNSIGIINVYRKDGSNLKTVYVGKSGNIRRTAVLPKGTYYLKCDGECGNDLGSNDTRDIFRRVGNFYWK